MERINVKVVEDVNPSYDEMGVPDAMRERPLTVARATKIAAAAPRALSSAAKAPISIQVALTDACFNTCIMCDHPMREKRMIKVEDWIGFLGSLEGVASVCYSGGDPMAYTDFNKIMSWHITKGIAFGITTSGHIPKHINMAFLAKAEWVRVSLDAITPEVYAECRGRIHVDKVIKGIDNMLKHGTNVQLGVTVHDKNKHDIKNVMEFAKGRGITEGFVHTVYPESSGDVKPQFNRNIMPFKHCSASLYQLYIDSNGDVYPCCIVAGDTRAAAQGSAIGNMLTQPWEEVWRDVQVFSKLPAEKLHSVCRHCVKRLSEINHVCDNIEMMDLTRTFF